MRFEEVIFGAAHFDRFLHLADVHELLEFSKKKYFFSTEILFGKNSEEICTEKLVPN